MALEVLKIIGLIILAVLCVVLVLVLLLLFVPVRYDVSTRISGEAKKAEAKAGWFFNLVKVTAAYDDGVLLVYVSLLGRRIYDIIPAKPGKAEDEAS